jgi:hypothetical protein
MEQLTDEQRQGVLRAIPVGRFCEPQVLSSDAHEVTWCGIQKLCVDSDEEH